jgi:2-dehydro-3-deoxyphosphogalactonate aldolase
MESRFSLLFKEMALIGIFRGITPPESEAVVGAAIDKGIRIVEVPLNSPEPLLSIEQLAKRFGDDVIVGAGTVTTVAEVIAVANAGGQLIVTPYARSTVVKKAKELGLAAVPGALTPTEIAEMYDCGADAVKLFPADLTPPTVIKALRAVLPASLPLVPVGGINIENMPAYLKAGVNGFGLGSALYRAGDSTDQVAEKASTFVRRMKELSEQ